MIDLYKYISNYIILEGGAAGHMLHPSDYDDLTLSDIIELIQNLFSGKIENITEKIDGTNIQATMNSSGEVVFVRNKGDLNSLKGGMSIDDMAIKWADKPNVANTFVTAGNIIKQVFEKIGKEFFNPDPATKILVNCECVTAGVTNIIPYPSDQVDFHDLWIYKYNGSEWVKDSVTKQGLNVLNDACKFIDKAQITPNIIISMTDKNESLSNKYVKEIKKIMKNSNTIEEFKRNQFNKYISINYPWLLDDETGVDLLFNRWIKGNKGSAFNIRNIKKIYSNNIDDISILDKTKYKDIIDYCYGPLDNFFAKLGNEIINMCKEIINSNSKDKVILQLKQELNKVISDVNNSNDLDLKYRLERQLNRLEKLGNQINPVEGIVFNYKGKIMKLTGSFAALNQILGSIKYGK